MSCVLGLRHTITLSDDGTAYSFGSNHYGQLGLGDNIERCYEPSTIPTLPKIEMVSCGALFTVCVDTEGFLWSFGFNVRGQLGTGDTQQYNIPQKIENIPLVHSVSCGGAHTLIITHTDDLWSFGYNGFGQLCLENKDDQLKPIQTSFSTISKIATGNYFSFFQNIDGEIFGCGTNHYGDLNKVKDKKRF